MNIDNLISSRVKSLKASAIREIFKLIAQKDVVSLAGGVPSPQLFPKEELSAISQELLLNNSDVALQYGITEGYTPLRDFVASRYSALLKEGEQVTITAGGQQAIELVAKSVIEDGDTVVVESPSFIGALNSFRSFNARLVGVPVQSDGCDLEALEVILQKQKVKLVYTISTFQNPSGITMSLEKRKALIDLAEKYDFLILEDNPYGELRFQGQPVLSIKELDQTGRTAYVGSFSKILSPGLRVGFLIANPTLNERCVVCKQVNDVHTSLLPQMLVAEFVKRYSLDQHIEKAKELYGQRCRYMLQCMDQFFPKSVSYTRPDGGIFIYCTMQNGIDALDLLKDCISKKVAFVPGNTFMIDLEEKSSSFRLNFSLTPNEVIEKGISLIASSIKDMEGGAKI